MSLAKPKFGPCFAVILAFAIVAFLVVGSGALPTAVVHAGPLLPCTTSPAPCTIGPNLELINVTGALFSGTGPCTGGTETFDTSATDPGFSFTDIPTPCAGFSSTQSGTVSVSALSGYQIEDFTGADTCGVTGGDSLTFSALSIVLTCPSETTVGATGTVSGNATFTPVTSLAETVTLSNTFTSGGSSSLSTAALNWSLLAPVPEPSSFTLLFAGLIGFACISRRRLLRR